MSGGKSGGSNFSGKDARNLITQQGNENRISQITPGGSLIYGTLDANGQFQQRPGGIASQTVETPYQQQMRTSQEGTATNLAGQLGANANNLQQLNFSGLPQGASSIDWSKVQGVPGADQFGAAANRASSAAYERAAQLARPDWEQGQRRLDQSLADQGLPMGGEAYSNEQNRYQRQLEGMQNNLALGAVGAGNDEAARLYQQALQGREAQIGGQTTDIGLANQARSQGIAEQTGLRGSQLSELAALLGGQYQPTPPASFNAPAGVDVNGAYQMKQNAQLAGQQQQSGLWGNLAGLGGSLGSAYLLCWVAREVYGVKDPRWIRFREWMLTRAPKWLLRLYLRKGAKFALWLHDRPAYKPLVRFLMDRCI